MSTENATTEEIATEPAVSWEVAILDKKEPVKLTADLIRSESKVLTDLTISSILDEKGYEAVKKAKNKAVKTRTAIERVEKDVLTEVKTRHTAEIKQIKDYAEQLYIACREVEKDLGDKLTTIDTEKQAALEKEEKERKEKTEGRQQKMFGLGMAFNGQIYFGYGKQVTPESLTGMSDERYAAWCEDLAACQMEQGVTGSPVAPLPANAPAPASPAWGSSSGGSVGGWPAAKPEVKKHVSPFAAEAVLHYTAVPNSGFHIYITKGAQQITNNAVISNSDINGSGYFLQVITE